MQQARFCLQRVCDDATLNRLRNGVGPPRHRVYILPTPRRRCRRHCVALALATSLRRVRNAEQAARKRQLQPAQDRRQAEAAARKKDADKIYDVGRSRALRRALRALLRVLRQLTPQVKRRGPDEVHGAVLAVALRAIRAPLDSKQTRLYGQLLEERRSRARAPEKPLPPPPPPSPPPERPSTPVPDRVVQPGEPWPAATMEEGGKIPRKPKRKARPAPPAPRRPPRPSPGSPPAPTAPALPKKKRPRPSQGQRDRAKKRKQREAGVAPQ
jgi:hypothetical protein